jgi:hypothetical protein
MHMHLRVAISFKCSALLIPMCGEPKHHTYLLLFGSPNMGSCPVILLFQTGLRGLGPIIFLSPNYRVLFIILFIRNNLRNQMIGGQRDI